MQFFVLVLCKHIRHTNLHRFLHRKNHKHTEDRTDTHTNIHKVLHIVVIRDGWIWIYFAKWF